MLTPKRQLGNLGEDLAVNFLRRQGLKILDRNFSTKFGELDIVAAKPGGFFKGKIEEMIFAEVKTVKAGVLLARAAQNVHFSKKERLKKTAKI